MDSIEALRSMLRDTDEEVVFISLGDRSMKLSTKAVLLALTKPVAGDKNPDAKRKK